MRFSLKILMKRLTIIILIVVASLLLIAGWLYFTNRSVPSSPSTDSNPFGSTTIGGTATGGGPTLVVTATDGSSYKIPDFTAGKKADTLPAGTYYHLTDNQDTQGEQAQFEIQYGTDNSITIVLLKEPLGSSRFAAENSLRSFFPLSDEALCKLDVFVSVPTSINETFAGHNLGLSFCPGATKLP